MQVVKQAPRRVRENVPVDLAARIHDLLERVVNGDVRSFEVERTQRGVVILVTDREFVAIET